MKKNLINLNFWVNKLITKKGKKSKVSVIMDSVYLELLKSTKKEPFEILNQAVENIMPIFLLNNKKIGKRVIVTPLFLLSMHLRKSLGIKWLVEAAKKRPGNFSKNLVFEILEALDNKGSVKKRQKDLNLLVLENKSNLKYRW